MKDFIAYKLGDVQSPQKGITERTWMSETGQRFAYRCLPLVHANELGWDIINEVPFKVNWDGSDDLENMKVDFYQKKYPVTCIPRSHFGHGVLTFQIPFLFRTPENISLLVTGPFNYIKDGIMPLTGLVETDWSDATFTMNWKFTRPCEIYFEENEPICRVLPIDTYLVKDINPIIKDITEDKEMSKRYEEWADSRGRFLIYLKTNMIEEDWQKDYFKESKLKRLNLKDFKER